MLGKLEGVWSVTVLLTLEMTHEKNLKDETQDHS